MSYLRFSRSEYDTLLRVVASLDAPPRLHALKRFLVTALSKTHPALAGKIGQLKSRHLCLLYEYLWGWPRLKEQTALTLDEISKVEQAFGALPFRSRFRGPLKRALVLRLLEDCPDLSRKVDALSAEQFDALCEYVRQKGL
jgi:hypothetical protein